MRLLLLVSVATLLSWPSDVAQAAPLKDPATAFPEQTLAYGEIQDPGKLFQEIDALFKGSALDNMPDSLVHFRQRHGLHRSLSEHPEEALGVVGLMLSRDVRREMQRFAGAAIGLTGLTRDGQPEFVAIILPGRSTLPDLAFRTLVSVTPTAVAGDVDGVILYRPGGPGESRPIRRMERIPPAPPGVPAPPPGGPVPPINDPIPAPGRSPANSHEPVVARVSGAILIGTQAAVTQAIHRIQGKGSGKSLADSESLRQARTEAGKAPGLFGYVNVPQIVDLIARTQGDTARGRLALLKELINPAAFRYEALSLTLTNGTLRYRQLVALDPKEKSPALAVLPTKPVDDDLLHFAPHDALFAFVLSNADGEKRWTTVMKLADQIAKANGESEHLPSAHVKEAEGALGIDIGKDIFGRIADIGVALGDPFKAVPATGERTPASLRSFLFPIRATDAKAAEALLSEVLPKLLQAITHGEGAEPTSEKVGDHTLHRIAVNGQTVHFGRHGAMIVFGFDAKTVAAALTGGANKQGYLADARTRAAVNKLDHPLAVFVSRPLPSLVSLFYMVGWVHETSSSAPAIEAQPATPADAAPPPPPPPPSQAARPGQRDIIRVAAVTTPAEGTETPQDPRQMLQALMRQFDQMGPFVMSWTRTGDRLVFEAQQTELKPGVARLTNWLLEQYFRSESRRQPARGIRFIPPTRPAPAAPPPPPPALRQR